MVERRYLLDTNVLSEPLKPRPNAGVLRGMEKQAGQLVTAAPVWHELVFGCDRLPASERKRAIDRYLREVVATTLTIFPYDQAAARWHGTQRARLEKVGRHPAFVDGQIAAIAAVNGAVLVTRNVADYGAFSGLVVQNWFSD